LEHQAEVVRRYLLPAVLSQVGINLTIVSSAGYLTFVESILRDSGNPTDPLERMLIEQLVLCHVRLQALYVRAAEAQTLEAAEVYNAMCVRLAGEFRKLTLAVDQYRAGRQSRSGGVPPKVSETHEHGQQTGK
jgi:hypothetical protein